MRHARTDARRRRLTVVGAVAALAVAAWIVAYRAGAGGLQLDGALGIYVVIVGVILFSIAAPGRDFTRHPVARGRVVAIIPAYNEDPHALHGTIRSLLDSTIPPDEVHVVDDGSAEPIPAMRHTRVFWHRQANGGKRTAQALVLRQILADHARGVHRADFVLTVDSDGDIDRYAIAHLLRAMSDPHVQAATGLPLTRNLSGLLPRLIDLEVTSICMTYRAARSHLGSQTTCSGALSLYRAGLVLDNLDDYTSGANAGDDRRLTHYALLRGRVVSVSEAIVHTDMPTRLRQLYRQRVRWSTSHWHYTPWEIRTLPTEAAMWTLYNLVLSVLVPMSLVWVLVVDPLLGNGFAWQAFAYWAVIVWLSTLKYAVGRPRTPWWQRWLTWLVSPPLLVVLQVCLLRPAMLHALVRVRSTGWGTRGPAAPAELPAAEGPSAAEAWLFGAEVDDDGRRVLAGAGAP